MATHNSTPDKSKIVYTRPYSYGLMNYHSENPYCLFHTDEFRHNKMHARSLSSNCGYDDFKYGNHTVFPSSWYPQNDRSEHFFPMPIPDSVNYNYYSDPYENGFQNYYHTDSQYAERWNEFNMPNNYDKWTPQQEHSDIVSYSTDQTNSTSLLMKLQEEIQSLFHVNVCEILKNHQTLIKEQQQLLEDIDDDHDAKSIIDAKIQELNDQMQTFQNAMSNLCTIYPSTIKEAYRQLNKSKREIEHLKSRLPIYARREQLIDTIKSNRVTIIKADTGSGKSSQLVQYLADAGFANRGQIVCSQPRRLAARQLATRVAKEFGCQVGEAIGCHVGGSKPKISHRTRIRFVTDAVLLNEYQEDPMLKTYSIVIIDEAHERHIDTDLLFGVMKLCLNKRPDIKLIIMSATLDDNLLSRYYNDSCLIEIPGRTFPIKDVYALEDVESYIDEAVNKVVEIHTSGVSGDILVFLTGQDEISRAIEEVNKRINSSELVLLLPLHGKLSEEETQAVFMTKTNSKQRKIIFSTNVAETSITIDGIHHVIDSGMVKEVMWDSKRHIRVLKIGYTTQSSIKQRRGRAGRTSSGTCYHLYTYETYQSLEMCSRAEVLCIQPSMAVLKLKHLNIIDDIMQFDWLERPSNSSLEEAATSLTWLGAIDSSTGKLTDLGHSISRLGIEPSISVMLLMGQTLNCLDHVLALAGMLSVVHNIWWRSDDDRTKAASEEIRASFAFETNTGGDFIALIRIFLQWYNAGDKWAARKAWCLKHMVRFKSMRMADSVVRELRYQMNPNFYFHLTELNEELIGRILRCICAGFFQNLAVSNGPIRAGYQLMSGTVDAIAHVHRSSLVTFLPQAPRYILYHEIVNINETNYVSVVCPIELDWLNKSWLSSLPRSPTQCAFFSYTFVNIGPALLLALVGKRFARLSELQDQLHVLFEIDRAQSKLTIWGQSDKVVNAQEYLDKIIKKERERLRNELHEFQVVGSVRILLGPGAEPRLVLVDDEYVKVFLKNLPNDVSEGQIQQMCELFGTGKLTNIFEELSLVNNRVVNVALIRKNSDQCSAFVTFATPNSAQLAVAKLPFEKLNNQPVHASPSYRRTSLDVSKPYYQLKAQWFMTESEGTGRLTFNNREKAQQAYDLLTNRYRFRCQFEMSLTKPVVKCSWPFKPHYGRAIINFPTVEQAQEALEGKYPHPFILQRNRRSNSSIYIRNVPLDLNEIDLQTIFTNSNRVVMLRISKNSLVLTPFGTAEKIQELFSAYASFQHESIFVEPFQHDGCVTAFIQFSDEQEMRRAVDEINSMRKTVDAGIVRLSIQEQSPSKLTKNTTEQKQDEFRVKFYRLSPQIDERFLTQQLDRSGLTDCLTYIVVYRKKLPAHYLSGECEMLAADNEKALTQLKSLFVDHDLFKSEPTIEIRKPTEDGRGVAYIRFDDPRDVLSAINISNSFEIAAMDNVGLKKLHFVPIMVHKIFISQALAKVINGKIEQTVCNIKASSDFKKVAVLKKSIIKNDQSEVVIIIRGNHIHQFYKVRIIFDELLKGLPFQLYNQSWITVLFDSRGQSFLQDVQNRTGTYIWWNWKSSLLRIFGEDEACRSAYTQIEDFIQTTLSKRQCSVSISIPKECIRHCIRNSNVLHELNTKQTKVKMNLVKHLIFVSGDQAHVKICEQKIKEFFDKCTLESTHSIDIASRVTMIDNKNDICPICNCDFDCPYTLEQCGHTICRSCLSTYFDTHLDVTSSTEAFIISCPIHECNERCLIRDIIAVIGFNRMARLAMIAFQIYIRQEDNDLVQCNGIDCKQVYRSSKDRSTYFCDQCVKFYCITCNSEYHIGMTCEQYKILKEQKDENAILEYNIGKLPYKCCPKCRAPIDKYAGCNAVKCTLCSTQFCWRCGAIDPIDIHNHFTDMNSPCFNRMLDDNTEDDLLDELI